MTFSLYVYPKILLLEIRVVLSERLEGVGYASVKPLPCTT